MTRLVVLLFGPPGAGKTTAAHELATEHGLHLYDRDDKQWRTEKQFRVALARIGRVHDARAVVIRSGATSTARARAARLVGATHGYLLDPGPDVCAQRVRDRRRADFVTGIRAVSTWYQARDQDDRVPLYRGVLDERSTWRPIRLDQRGQGYAKKLARYGYPHQLARKQWAQTLPRPCTVCEQPVTAAMPWDLDHTDDGSGYLGPAHRRCNRVKGARKGSKARITSARIDDGGTWLTL